MTVNDLIKKLEKVNNKEIEVVIHGEDHTNYSYYNDILGLGVEKVYRCEYDEEKTEFFIINGGEF